MPNQMERFTQPARYTLSMAQEAAEELESGEINLTHMLLGMTRAEKTIACKVLEDNDIIEAKLLPFVKSNSQAFFREITSKKRELDLSDGVKVSLELGVDTARRYGFHQIDSVHLLIGVMKVGSAPFLRQQVKQENTSIEAILKHFDVSSSAIIKRAEYYINDEAYLDDMPGCGEMLLSLFSNGKRKRKNDE